MNLDQIKTAWKAYDSRLQSSKALSDKLIVSMITERSTSRFATVKRNYLVGFTWMALCLVPGIAIMAGNPFDYTYRAQYIPALIYCICLFILIIAMARHYSSLNNITLSQATLRAALKDIIAVYERPQKFTGYTLRVFVFSQLFLFPLSFLPKNIERMGVGPALVERLIPIGIAALLYYIAHKAGAFKQRDAQKFKADLTELEQLQAMADELTESRGDNDSQGA
jgi:hypothetical protein